MNNDDKWQRLVGHEISRRRLLAAGGVATATAAGSLLSACSGNTGGGNNDVDGMDCGDGSPGGRDLPWPDGGSDGRDLPRGDGGPDGGDLPSEDGDTGSSTTEDLMTEINVRDDFGAVGDGSTDDTSAFINAFNAIPETGGRITIPAGEYILTQQLDIHNKAITIKGSGFGVTKLVWQAGDNGIVVTQDETDDGDAEKTRIYNLTLRDLSLIQEQDLSGGPQESGCALKVVYIAPSNREKLNCIVENVEIRGRDQFAFAHCWNNGVYFHNVINSMIRNASIDSRERGAMNNGIYFLGDPEVTPVECHIADCLIFGSQYGIQFDGHYEGIYITKCNLLHNTKAAIRATTSPDVVKPSFQIRGCQVEYFLNGFEISGLSGVMISDNFLFVSPGSASEIDNDTSVGIGVNGDSYQVFMANNIVHNAVGSTEGKHYRAVVLGDTRRCVISNNIINEPGNTEFSTGIWFRPGTEKCAAYDNVVSNSRDAYVDDPSNPSNVIRYDPILSD